jgi:putative ATP-dependent endonuclease of OLD family
MRRLAVVVSHVLSAHCFSLSRTRSATAHVAEDIPKASLMKITALTASGFRNLDGRFPLNGPLSVVVGENNVGKSNLIEALRILLRSEEGPRNQRWIGADDFACDSSGTRTTDTLELAAEFSELTPAQQARMVTCLSPALGEGRARLRVRAAISPEGRVTTSWFGGDSDHPDVEEFARSAVSYTYLPALRDASAELRPGRNNRLTALLSTLAPEGHSDRDEIVRLMSDANDKLGQVATLVTAKSEVQKALDDLTGDGPFTQRTDLAFSQPDFTKVVSTLRALVGSPDPLEILQNGLGYNNLLYMAVLLAALGKTANAELRVLLIEEPEAHLHPQLQQLLLSSLKSAAGERTQVVATSHSPNFASAAPLSSLVVLTSTAPDSPPKARTPLEFGLSPRHSNHLEKFLDATKASLFFARSTIFVEGLAEQLVLPELARLLGKPLDRHGVSVVNIGGVAFDPFAALYGADKLPHRCAIISDSDPAPAAPETEPAEEEVGRSESDQTDDSESSNSEASSRARRLKEVATGSSQVFLATNTFEWDLAAEETNWSTMLAALKCVKPRVARRLETECESEPPKARADQLLGAVKDRKGDFAQELALKLAGESEASFAVPKYIKDAIDWVIPGSPDEPQAEMEDHG